MFSIYDNNKTYNNNISGTWMFKLRKGDTVKLKSVGDNLAMYYDWRTHFTGLLIKAD